jgi:predicted RNase H-like HicB family nuclease
MRAYPAILTPDPDAGFRVTLREVPEAITEGGSREEALLRAEDSLESALAMYMPPRSRFLRRPRQTVDRIWCRFRR